MKALTGSLVMLLLACSAGAQAPAERRPVVLPVEAGATIDPSCQPAITAAGDFGCRGDWTCGEHDVRSLLCVPAEGGLLCSCATADASVAAASDAACGSASDVPSLAKSLCGWEVP